jgi:hypothetical protein
MFDAAQGSIGNGYPSNRSQHPGRGINIVVAEWFDRSIQSKAGGERDRVKAAHNDENAATAVTRSRRS